MKTLAVLLCLCAQLCVCKGLAARAAVGARAAMGARAAARTALRSAQPALDCKEQTLSRRNDNALERCGIYILCVLLCTICSDTTCWSDIGFDYTRNFVPVAKRLLKQRGKSMQMVSVSILELLNRVLPKAMREFFRSKYQENSQYICSASSQWFSFGFIEWLVGPAERFDVRVRVTGEGGSREEVWQSGVKLVECRFLVESQCKSACVHLCKTPTQALFRQELGVPLYMKPNYDDCSCEFFFGVEPPPLAEDPAITGGCYTQCSLRRVGCVDDKEQKS